MPASYIWAWIVLIAILLFAFSPEIKRFLIGKRGVEFEHFKEQVQKVDRALVEYDEFKKTIYPLLEITLGEISGIEHLGIRTKPELLIDYINRVEKIKKVQGENQLEPLIKAAKSAVIYAYAAQLNVITEGKVFSSNCFNSGLTNYASDTLVDRSKIYVDFQKLQSIGEQVSELDMKRLYFEILAKLKKYYNDNF
ncbi:hypothetical protein [Limosilactobacillus vaginalis]